RDVCLFPQWETQTVDHGKKTRVSIPKSAHKSHTPVSHAFIFTKSEPRIVSIQSVCISTVCVCVCGCVLVLVCVCVFRSVLCHTHHFHLLSLSLSHTHTLVHCRVEAADSLAVQWKVCQPDRIVLI